MYTHQKKQRIIVTKRRRQRRKIREIATYSFRRKPDESGIAATIEV